MSIDVINTKVSIDTSVVTLTLLIFSLQFFFNTYSKVLKFTHRVHASAVSLSQSVHNQILNLAQALTPTLLAPATTSHYPGGASQSASTKGSIWTEFDFQIFKSQEHCTAGTDATIEMRQYIEEKPILWDGDWGKWMNQHFLS
ncbi:hypothetical protein FQA47_002761 [Oryzias melastigma]|uniref:Uncharacterized protein n=1 Tax=Oryzias melastigma TaxID=30732 RepID=A0A834BZE2_ORYME|nr:hypothetical protein FQA47_002761 [Oryzias melastigma]